MSSANKFLGTGDFDVTNGSLNIFGSKIGGKNLQDSLKDNVKIDGSGRLFATDLAIDDISGLQAALNGTITNPVTANLDMNDFDIENAQTVEVSNGTVAATLNYTTGIINNVIDLQEVVEIADVTQNMLLTTTAGQTDIAGDLTTTGDFQFGGALVGDLVINDVNISGAQTSNLTVAVAGTVAASQSGTWATGSTDFVSIADVVDGSSKGVLLFAREEEAKTDDHAEPLNINANGQLLTYNNNPEVFLDEPVQAWNNVVSDSFTPFTEKFVDVQGASTADINGFYTSTTPTNDYNAIYVERKIKLNPFEAIEVTISGNFEYDTTTSSTQDYQCIGLMSNIPTGLGASPNSAIWFKATAFQVDQWFAQIINGGAMQTQNALTLQHTPGDDAYFCFRIRVFNNGGLISARWYDYDQATQKFTYMLELGLPVPLEDNEFYLTNYYGSSTGLTTTSKIVAYQIRVDHPNINPYPSFSRYLAYGHPAAVSLTTGAVRAITALRLNPSNTVQSTVCVVEIDTMCTSGGGQWMLGIYKNPTLSAGLAWNNYGRVQYSTQQAAITITGGHPSFLEYGLRWSGGGSAINHFRVPNGAVCLHEASDTIVIGIFSFTTESFASGFTVVY